MKVGKITSVEYDKFVVKLFHTTKISTVSIRGDIYYFGNIGSFLKIKNALDDNIICEVVAVVDKDTEYKTYSNYNLDSSRELILKPIGTLDKSNDFAMGVGIFPSIYSDVWIVTKEDVDAILASSRVPQNKNIGCGKEDNDCIIHREIEIGTSKNMINYKVNLNIDRLFNIHTAVLGNSGSGKSNTIAHILQEVYRKTNNSALGAKTILFDVNGEYKKAFEKLGSNGIEIKFYKPNLKESYSIEEVNGAKSAISIKEFFLPYYLMNLDEWLAFLLASERTQKPFWDKVLQESFKFYKIFQDKSNVVQSNYINYFKWKIRNILRDVLSKAESDTSKITAAQGVLVKSRDIVNTIKGDWHEITEFLNNANTACAIHYGDNQNKLITFLSELGIDNEEAVKIDNERLKSGEFFDYKFLKIAIEIVLLEEEARGSTRIREFVSTMISRLNYFIEAPDCDFMRESNETYSNEKEYLKNLFGIEEKSNNHQLIIIDSSEIGSDILELLTSTVSRMIFDYRKRLNGENRIKRPIHLILDEAHRYIKKDAEYILKENIFERIAREGRKFALYLLVSSQRPSELSSTVLSQCGNYIIHRIQNDLDMKYIYSVLPYYSDDYSIKIKQSVPGEALIFGNCVPLPLQIKVHRANPDPSSDNCKISEEWFEKKDALVNSDLV